MYLALTAVLILALLLIVDWNRRRKQQTQVDEHSVTAEELHSLLSSGPKVLVLDVRQPLDLLAYPELIPGAQRIAPKEVLANPSLIPRDIDAVVYCTCPSDKTSRAVLRLALELRLSRIKFLRGGLAAWKAKGYPVEPYRESFQLDVPTMAPPQA
jgi:rhodanese-related sulfurtransferase